MSVVQNSCSKKLLQDEYVKNKKTTRQIANEQNTSIFSICKLLKKFNIAVRKPSEYSHDSDNIRKLNDYKYMYSEYVENKKTTNEIALDLEVSSAAVKYSLKKFGIRRRKRGEYVCNEKSLKLLCDYEYMYNEYTVKKRNIYNMAADLGVYGSTVRRSLNKLGIARRKPSDSCHPDRIVAYKILNSREFLIDQYVVHKKAAYVIANELGVDPSTVCEYLRKHNVEVRSSFEYGSNISSLHLHSLVPLLDKYNIKHDTGYLLRDGGKVVYEIDEHLPDLKVFIELQGLYWHGYAGKNCITARKVGSDIRKWKFINNKHPDYKLIYILESDFEDGLAEQIVSSLLISDQKEITWNPSLYVVSNCTDGVEEFVYQHHYLRNIPPHKYLFVATKDGVLIAVAVFSSPSRNEQRRKYGEHVLELSRYCSIEHGTNLGSWFLSRCLKQIKERPIITYADITRYPGKLSHEGTLYKAANFQYLGLTGANYRYLTTDQRLLHKRAIWTRARRCGITEDEQAKNESLVKWYEWPKKIYIYK